MYKLGKTVRPAMQKGKWVWKSLGGSEEEAREAEYEAGKSLAEDFMAEAPVDDHPVIVALLNRVGGQLAGCIKDSNRTFTLRAVNVAEPNAFALPGGFIFVTRSLLELCGVEVPDERPEGDFRLKDFAPQSVREEVAVILGHEMGHVMRGHALDRMVNSTVVNTAMKVGLGGLLGRMLSSAGSKFLHGAYSQDQELEADEFGARLAAAAGYDPHAAVRLMKRLQGAAGEMDEGLLAYFKSHPPFDVRIEAPGGKIK